MLKEDALRELDKAPLGLSISKVNPHLTLNDVHKIIKEGLLTLNDGTELCPLWVKRVKQVVQNKRRPI